MLVRRRRLYLDKMNEEKTKQKADLYMKVCRSFKNSLPAFTIITI